MRGKEYLEDIRIKLEAGGRVHRMGENILRAFGYIRRRSTVIEEIKAALEDVELETTPLITTEMPLRSPRIVFRLKPKDGDIIVRDVDTTETLTTDATGVPSEYEDETDDTIPEPTFTVSELESAKRDVEIVLPNASIREAYTKMMLYKYSQLIVAKKVDPVTEEIEGIISFKSIAKALMNNKYETVHDCIDGNILRIQSDDDLIKILNRLDEYEIALVIGQDNKLQGIVTTWDLAKEFAHLVVPFKRVEEIEKTLRTLAITQLRKQTVINFLTQQNQSRGIPFRGIGKMTMGDLKNVLEFPEHWEKLRIPFDRGTFINAFEDALDYRNALMHSRGPLTKTEMAHLTNICDLVRQISD